MKKISILLITAMSCSLAFMGCGFNDLKVPKEVKIKTDATYEFSLMNFDSEKEGSKLKISNYFDFEKILEEKTSGTSESNNIKIYKYNDGSQYQQFLIHMPLKEIEFDFSESFKDMEFSKDMEDLNIKKEFKVPAITTPEREEPIDLRDVQDKLNLFVKFGTTDPSTLTANNLTVTFNTTSDIDFNEITYSSGYLIIKGVGGDELTGTVELSNGTETTAVSFSDNEAKIPLKNKTISKSGMTINFSDIGKKFLAEVQDGAVIKIATGVTLQGAYTPTIGTSDITFPFTLSDDIQNCTVTDGELEIKIKRPSAWADVITSYTINLSGGMDASFSELKTTETLTDKELRSGDIVASSNPVVIINNATLDFDSPPSVYAKVTITTISARVTLADDYDPTINSDKPVSTDITSYVNKIVWNPSGFNVIAVNDLPVGNDIDLTFNSPFFEMSGVSATIIAEGDSAEETTYTFRGDSTTTWFTTKPAGEEGKEVSTIEVSGEIGLPRDPGNTDEKTIDVHDVTPGKTYHLNLKVEPFLDWASANVKMPDDFDQNMNAQIDTGMNRKTLFESLGEQFAEKMKITSIPTYLFANIPDKLKDDNMKFEGTIRAFYGNKNGSQYDDVMPKKESFILGSETEPEVLNTDKPLEDFVINDKGEVTNKFGNTNLNFADAMNLYSEDGSLCVDYKIELQGSGKDNIDITPTYIETLKAQGKSAIKIDVVMLLTMDFTVTGTIDIDMLDLAKKQDSDLLGRSEATNTDSIEKFLDVVKTATLSVDNLKLPMTGDISLSVDMYKNGNKEIKPVGNGETFALEVNPLDVIKTYPLKPEIKFIIGKQNQTSNFGILRTTPISGKIRLRIDADGEIPIYPFSDNN